MYGGPGTDKGRPCRLSPGPIYMPGAGPDSWRGPKFSFGTGPPAGSCGASANKGSAQQPGPGDYDMTSWRHLACQKNKPGSLAQLGGFDALKTGDKIIIPDQLPAKPDALIEPA